MSANQVGHVYQKIIDDVINDSKNSFDEEGVLRQLLDDLKKTWETKLTARHVADMPWDPPPVQPTPAAAPVNLDQSNAASSKPQQNATPAAAAPIPKPEPVVKQEQPSYAEMQANVVPASQHGAGLQRAGQFIQDKFGSAANGSLAALQSSSAAQAARTQAQQHVQAQQQVQQQQLQQAQAQAQAKQSPLLHQQAVGPGMPMTPADMQRLEYNRMLNEQMRAQQQRAAAQQRSVVNGQTEGADEWKAFVAERRALSDEAVLAADMTLRQRIQQMSLEQEGGGVMLPVSKVRIPCVPVRRNPKQKQTQVDGADADDDDVKDEDEDAINSDLDDPDDDQGVNSEDEDNGGEVMVCLYDKVQRVKNKWKCTLKDGILSTGGKEYVFGKAQGEFEW